MQTLARLSVLLVVAVFAAALRGQPSLEHARAAQALLGPDTWSRILRVENTSRRSPYPKVVHALVFELAGILWFYTDTDGTQSFSLHRDNLAAEKADFAPLLRDLDRGFTRWTVVPDAPAETFVAKKPLPNGCFIESVAALRQRLRRGGFVGAPRLLSYYASTPAGRRGHTVLAYDCGDRVEIFDPGRPDASLAFPQAYGADPRQLARALLGRDALAARYLPLPDHSTHARIASKSGAQPSA